MNEWDGLTAGPTEFRLLSLLEICEPRARSKPLEFVLTIMEFNVHDNCPLCVRPSPAQKAADDRREMVSKTMAPVKPSGVSEVVRAARLSLPLALLALIGLAPITANALAWSQVREGNEGWTEQTTATGAIVSTVSRRIEFPLLASASSPAPCDAGLFTESVESGRELKPDAPNILRARYAGVRISRLRETARPHAGKPKNRVGLNLFEDVCFTAVLDRAQSRPNRLIWIGHIVGAPHSQVTLVADKDILSGNITAFGRTYQVRYAGDGLHAVYRIDPNAFPAEAPPLKSPSP